MPRVQWAKSSPLGMFFLNFWPHGQIILVLAKELEELMQHSPAHLAWRNTACIEASSWGLCNHDIRCGCTAFRITLDSQSLQVCLKAFGIRFRQRPEHD
jgi:hypothetical protein